VPKAIAKPTPKPAPKVTAKPTAPASKAPPPGFAVQLGSFTEQANATRYATRIKGAGFNAFVVRGAAANGSIYRVYSGPEATRDAADQLAGKLKSAGYSVMVVELGGANGG
jgi:DedD protein